MTKRQLIDEMAEGAGIHKHQAGRALNSLLDTIRNSMKAKNGRIALSGFGTFSRVHRKARKGMNPATGETITIDARDAIKFQTSQILKDALS